MGKGIFKYFLCLIFGVLILYHLIFKPFGIFVIYKNPTTSNEPNLPYKSKTLVTNLNELKINDFVCYRFSDSLLGDHIRAHRLVAFENDVIELRKGIVYVNDINFDRKLNLNHSYKTSLSNIEKLKELKLNVLENARIERNDIVFDFPDSEIKNFNFNYTRLIDSIGLPNRQIFNLYNKQWNKDNFGPLLVPQGKIFVLGDNRDYTIDSRTIGFIDKKDIVGTVFKIL